MSDGYGGFCCPGGLETDVEGCPDEEEHQSGMLLAKRLES